MNKADMNRPKVEELIHHLKTHNETQFNMSGYFEPVRDKKHHICGTAACIAGHTLVMEGDARLGNLTGTDIFEEAQRLLGLPNEIATSLFLGDGVRYAATKREAIKTLEILLETGTVDWSHAEHRYRYGARK